MQRIILRVFFYLIYQPLAFLYDWVAALVSFGQWRHWVLAVQPHLGDDPILELGHGPGHLQLALGKKGRQIFGVDLSAQMGRLARRRLESEMIKPRLARAQVQKLPFQGKAFATVVATFPAEYIFSSESLAEIQRTLKPGGKLIVLLASHITGRRPLQVATAWLYRLTGQGIPSEQLLEAARGKLNAAGLEGNFEWHQLEGAQLLLFNGVLREGDGRSTPQ